MQQGLTKNEFAVNLLLLASQLSYELHDSTQAENYLLKAKKVAEDDEEVLMRLTNLYLEEERFEDVLALENDDIDNLLTKWNVAKAHQALENEEAALAIYEDLASDLQENPEFLQDYAYILREFGYRERARDIAERYLKLVPDDVNMLDFLSE